MPKLTPLKALQNLVAAVGAMDQSIGNEPGMLKAYTEAVEALAAKTKTPPKAKPDATYREALKLARIKVKDQLVLKGYDPKTLPGETLDFLVSQLMAKDPYFLDEATKRLAAAQGANPEGVLSIAEPQS